MKNPYHEACLRLILGISKALEQMEEKNYAAAEQILRKAWEEAAGSPPQSLLLR